jgi:hypothetical protein
MNESLAVFDSPRQYYIKLTEFKRRKAFTRFEAVTKVVRPMQMEQAKSRFEHSGAKTPGYGSTPSELSDFQRTENHNRAVRRARQSVRHLVKEGGFDRLFTMTYRENMEDRERAKADLKAFVRLARKVVGDWPYVCVLEKQDRGAYHFHCAVRGYQQIKLLRACWHQVLGVKGSVKAMRERGVVLARGEDSPGNVNIRPPADARRGSDREWKPDRLAGYMCKYMAKTFSESDAEKHRYLHSKDITKPEASRIWLGATNMSEAIAETYSFMQTFLGLGVDCDMWLSSSGDSFWMAGRGDT